MKPLYIIFIVSILLYPTKTIANTFLSIKIDSTSNYVRKGKCTQSIKGTVYYQSPNNKIKYAIVMLRDAKNKLVHMYQTRGEAKFFFNVNCNETYKLETYKKGYKTFGITLKTTSENKLILVKNLMVTSKRKKGGKKAALMEGKVFFDLNEIKLTAKAKYELSKAISLLRANKRLIIRFESHTDCRAPSHVNNYFSQKRVDILQEYVNGKVEENRTEGKAFGEKKPLNRCVKGVKCTEREHFANRRTTFVVKERDSI